MNGPERILFIEKTADPIFCVCLMIVLLIMYTAYRMKRIYLEMTGTFTLLFGSIAYLLWRSEVVLSAYR